ncbi:MAG: hypothetical protein CVV49_08385 [Spirochaetae bacterium HGW-Spirochaetae-5]|nr:MAG: hypothetical protein CVV49_08385 [Spirochaetae bacterium HGW-Spirochaetae-5]
MKKIFYLISKRQRILYEVIPFIALIILSKYFVHRFSLEFISLNSIFSGIIGANVFLMGFLLNGVLSDYKESEKLPGELSAMIATMSDEMEIMCRSKKSQIPLEAMKHLLLLSLSIRDWFFKREETDSVLRRITSLNGYFLSFEPLTQANFIARLKQEQNSLRKLIIRIHTIRETSFISSGYFIASTTTILLVLGLIFSKIEPFYESYFFVSVVSYLLIYLIFLIKDLDNPFGYSEDISSEDVSLKPLDDVINDIGARISDISAIINHSNSAEVKAQTSAKKTIRPVKARQK